MFVKLVIKPYPTDIPHDQLKLLIAKTLDTDQLKVVRDRRHNQVLVTVKLGPGESQETCCFVKKFTHPGTGTELVLQSFDPKSSTSKGDSKQKTSCSPRNLNDQVTPLWRLTYEKQLALKHKQMQLLLVPRFLKSDSQLEPIISSPLTTGYRNKVEFTIGLDSDKRPCVGYLLGGFKEGIVEVADPGQTLHTSPESKAFCQELQRFLEESPLEPFDRVTKTGFWRLAMVRVHTLDQNEAATNLTDLMVMVQVQKGHTKADAERARFVDRFKTSIKSIHWQETEAVHHGVDDKASIMCLHGPPFLMQTLLGLNFCVSPRSFFQVNTQCAALLYTTIKDYLLLHNAEEQKVTFLDLCCGTGSIALCLARYVNQVIGIESVPQAILDAQENARLNNVFNCEFITGKVEETLLSILERRNDENPLSVVLDPPRSGVQKSVIKDLIRCERVQRIVYVSCDPLQAEINWKMLLLGGFEMIKARAVDMFPHTAHIELVVLFQRKKKEDKLGEGAREMFESSSYFRGGKGEERIRLGLHKQIKALLKQ